MSTTPPEAGIRPPDAGGGVLARSDEGRMFTGVCAGLGRYAGIDPVLVRVGIAVLVLGSGIGIFLYIAAFLLMRHPDGGPGYAEQWTNRVIDSQTVLALLTAVLGFGLMMNLFADSTGPGTIVVGTMIAIALLAARSRGVDLLAVARSLPDRMSRRRGRGFASVGGPYPAYGQDAYESPYQEAATARAGAPAAGPPVVPPEPVTAESGAEPPVVPPEPVTAESGAEPTTTREGSRFGERPAGSADPTTVLPNPLVDDAPVTAASADAHDAEGFRKLKDLAQEARTSAYASQEPFAPRGPYAPPTRYAEDDPFGYHTGYGYPPYGLDVHGAPVATTTTRKRPRSFVGLVTIFVAMLVGGIMVATQPSGSAVNLPLAGGAVLITIGAGLLVATWFGRGVGLIAVGTIVSLVLIAGGTLDGMPKRVGSYTWAPATTAEALTDRYEVGIGDATLDLSDTVAAPGSRTRLNVTISVGSMEVIVPPTARVEVEARVRVGDITIGRSMRSGTGLSLRTVLDPENAGSAPAPIYELHLKGGLGDVEVRHG